MLAVGWVLRRAGRLKLEADASLLQLGVNIFYPSLIVETILGNPALARVENILLPAAVGAGTVLFGFAVAVAAARILRVPWPQPARTFGFSVGLQNYGFIAIPLVQLLFDRATMGVLFTYSLGVEIALWSTGIWLLAGQRSGSFWRAALTPPVIAIVASLVVNLSLGSAWLPAFVRTALHWLGVCAFPIQLIVTGATLADLVRRNAVIPNLSTLIGANIVRLGLLPLVMLAFARSLGDSRELQQVVVVQAAMPSAMIPVILAKYYKADSDLAAWIVITTTVLGLFMIPFWLRFSLVIFS